MWKDIEETSVGEGMKVESCMAHDSPLSVSMLY